MTKNNEKKSIHRIFRSLHRDIGFLVIGLTLMYCVSGITLIYRDQGFLKFEEHVEADVSPGLSGQDLGAALHLRRMKVERTDGDIIYFDAGEYDTATGHASYTVSSYPWIIDQFNSLHLSPSTSTIHVFGVLYGSMLLFLAVSSFFMYKPGTKQARRGFVLASLGGVAAFIVILVL